MQNFTDIPSSRTLSDSLIEILNNDKTAISCNSGTTFPTTNLQIGMLCYRTDQLKLYQLIGTNPDNWRFIMDLASGIDTQFAAKLNAASYTAADVLAKLLTVDGAGTGLDADLLDGQHASAFASSTHNHNAAYLGITAKAADADNLARGIITRDDLLDHAQNFMQNPRGTEAILQAVEKKMFNQFRTVTVFTYYGESGTGKTLEAVYNAGDPLSYFRMPVPKGDVWWDGYDPSIHKVLILDEYNGWMQLNMLKQVLDGYPLRIEIKGGQTYAAWTTVYITSNTRPHDWYPNICKGDWEALVRRCPCCRRLPCSTTDVPGTRPPTGISGVHSLVQYL